MVHIEKDPHIRDPEEWTAQEWHDMGLTLVAACHEGGCKINVQSSNQRPPCERTHEDGEPTKVQCLRMGLDATVYARKLAKERGETIHDPGAHWYNPRSDTIPL